MNVCPDDKSPHDAPVDQAGGRHRQSQPDDAVQTATGEEDETIESTPSHLPEPSASGSSSPPPRSRTPRPRLALTLGAVAACACGVSDDPSSTSASAVRDSAGVRVAEHPPLRSIDTIPDEPVLTIGRMGDPEDEFFRVSGVFALGAGEIVVANAGTYELRFYSPEGEYLRSFGREGDGPSEFGFMGGTRRGVGDTLSVMDPRRRRVTLVAPEGELGRAVPYGEELQVDRPPGDWGQCVLPGLLGLTDDGTRVVSGWGCTALEGSDGRRETTVHLHFTRDASTDTLVLPWTVRWERGGAEEPRDRLALIPFAPSMSWALDGNRLVTTRGREYEVDVHDSSADLIARYREGGSPPPVTEAHRDTYRAEQEEAGRPHPPEVPFAERFPAYDQLVFSYEGDIWARRGSAPGTTDHVWTVFSADGSGVRHVLLPDIVLRDVRDGLAYGTRSNELDVETVVVYDVG